MKPWSLSPLSVAIFVALSHGIAFSAILLASTPVLHAFITGAALSTSSQTTNGPVALNGLAKRQFMGNTCGYVNGNPSIPFFCPTSSTCYLSSSTAAYGDRLRVCCQSNSQVSCEIRDDCVGYYDTRTVASPISDTVQCTNLNDPYCQTYTFPNLGIVQYGCGGNSDNSLIPIVTYSGEVVPTGLTSNTVVTVTAKPSSSSVQTSQSSTSQSSSPRSSTLQGSPPGSSTLQSSSPGSSTWQSSSPQSTTPQSSISKKNTPVGAIVGGVISGLIVVGVIIVILFKIHKQKARPDVPAPGPTPVSAPSLHPKHGNAGQVPNGQEAHATDGLRQSDYGPDMTISSIRDGLYSPESQHSTQITSPQLSDTSRTHSTQTILFHESSVAEAGGQEVNSTAIPTAIPTEKYGEPIFEAPSGN